MLKVSGTDRLRSARGDSVRKPAKPLFLTLDLLRQIIIHLHSQLIRLLPLPNILHARRRIRQDHVADTMLVHLLDAEVVDVDHLARVLLRVDGEHTGPPFDLVLEAGEVEGVFEGYFAIHGLCWDRGTGLGAIGWFVW